MFALRVFVKNAEIVIEWVSLNFVIKHALHEQVVQPSTDLKNYIIFSSAKLYLFAGNLSSSSSLSSSLSL
jgi:hypothetical protein